MKNVKPKNYDFQIKNIARSCLIHLIHLIILMFKNYFSNTLNHELLEPLARRSQLNEFLILIISNFSN